METLLACIITGPVCYLFGYQTSATRIWNIFIEASERFPDDKLSEITDVLKQNKPNLFGWLKQ